MRKLKEAEYYLKYKDDIVLLFNIETQSIQIENKNLLPISVKNRNGYDIISTFCSNRVLMMNREYCKEILIACQVEDQSDINICIVSRALSFRDNYWICSTSSPEKWENINLYKNTFSADIAVVSLTGSSEGLETITDVYTGELTNKGTRAKCLMRDEIGLFLAKSEAINEIKSEVLSFYLAKALGVQASKYVYVNMLGKDAAVCRIETSEERELIPYRDFMLCYNEPRMSYTNVSYKKLMEIDADGFLLMQVFDYITLNTDRNRDNFGVLMENGAFKSMYPLFDHDSCFKGKSVGALYFPTGVTFKKTIEILKTEYNNEYTQVISKIKGFKEVMHSQEGRKVFLTYKTEQEYNEMLSRVNDLL